MSATTPPSPPKRYSQQCTRCHWRDEIRVPSGVHPPCPLCGSATERLWTGDALDHSVRGDECDYLDHTLGALEGHQGPLRIRSWAERARLMAKHGLADAPYYRHETDAPTPAVDWNAAAPDPQTQANVKELLERAFRDPMPPRESTVNGIRLEQGTLSKDEADTLISQIQESE